MPFDQRLIDYSPEYNYIYRKPRGRKLYIAFQLIGNLHGFVGFEEHLKRVEKWRAKIARRTQVNRLQRKVPGRAR